MPLFGSSFRALRDRGDLDVVFGGISRIRANHFTISHTQGGRTDRLNGLVIRSGHGLGGLVMTSARTATVRDYLSDDNITHAYDDAVSAEGLRLVTAVPVTVRGTVRGVLYGAMRDAACLTPDATNAMRRVADDIGFDLAVAEEVRRRSEVAEAAEHLRDARLAAPDRAWEDVRAAFAELRQLAHEVTDDDLRSRLDSIVGRMAQPRLTTGPRLSDREVDVLAIVAMGCANAEVAARLNLQPETVKSYLRTASRKLGATNRMDAVARARATGQLP